MKRLLSYFLILALLAVMFSGTVSAADSLTIVSVTPDRLVAYEGDTITWTVITAGGTGGHVYYNYSVYFNGSIQSSAMGWGSNIYSIKAWSAGKYHLSCSAIETHEGERVPFAAGSASMDSAVTTVAKPLSILSVYPDKTSANAGDSITWTVSTSGGIPGFTTSWGINNGNDTVNISGKLALKTYTYTTVTPGLYSAEVWVWDGGGSCVGSSSGINVNVKQGLVIKSIDPVKEFAKTGDNIRWVMTAVGGAGSVSYQYSFDLYKDGILLLKNPWNKSISYNYKTTTPGTYHVVGYVWDGTGQAAKASVPIRVADPLSILSVSANRSTAPLGAEVIWTVSIKGGLYASFSFSLFKGSQYVSGNNFSASNSYLCVPPSAGNYHAGVSVYDVFGDLNTLDSAIVPVYALTVLSIKSIKVDKTSVAVGSKITWTAFAMGGSGSKQFKFNIYKDGTLLKTGSFTSSAQLAFTPAAAGKYKVAVFVKDSTTTTSSPVYSEETVAYALVPLMGSLPIGVMAAFSPAPEFMRIKIPGLVTVIVTPKPTTRQQATPAPEPTSEPTPETTYPIYVVITGIIILPTPSPTVGID